jgi:hypothetical protein
MYDKEGNLIKNSCLWTNNQKDDCKNCCYPAFHLVNGKCVKREGALSDNTMPK